MIRKANNNDKNIIMEIIQDAIIDMENQNIYQWDSIYPNKEVIVEAISK